MFVVCIVVLKRNLEGRCIFKMIILMLCSLCGLLSPCVSIVAYDCSHPDTNMTAVSLSTITPCSGPRTSLTYDTVELQLLQERTSDFVFVHACLVERSYEIFHCGMHSHSTAMAGGFVAGELMAIGHDACQQAHALGILQVGRGYTISGLKPNTSGVHPVVELGSINPGSHRCQGVNFELRGVSYFDAVMRSSYKVTLVQTRLPLDLKAGKVRTPAGFAYTYTDGAAFDADFGNIYWDADSHVSRCSPTAYLVLYEGPGLIVGEPSGVKTLLVNASEQAMAVTLGSRTTMCYQAAFKTEHPKLFVATKEPGSPAFFFQASPVEPTDVDLFLYMNSKLMFVERHIGAEMQSLYRHVHERICELKQQTLRQLASVGFTSPEEFAWLYTGQAGVTAVAKGEVVYLITCPAVQVEFRPTSHCYQEMPVYDPSNRTAFVKPRSRVITYHGTETDCSPLAPAMFFMGTGWITLAPTPRDGQPPQIMSAEPRSGWSYKNVPNLVSAGLYSKETLSRFQDRLLFPVARDAVVNTMAAAMAGYGVGDHSLDAGRLLKEYSLDALQTSFMTRMYGWWWTFSTHMAGVLGVVVILGFIKMICSMGIHGKLLYEAYGWSVKLLGCVCGALTKLLLIRHTQVVSRPTDPEQLALTEVPVEEAAVEPDRSSPPAVYPVVNRPSSGFVYGPRRD
uniref:Glycoprotein n=1 Tax=Nanning Chuvi tick virus 2 TaxID=2972095 RepID=A0A9E8A9I8_9VIRU|nr:MAG: glycoprotein [Nanning Chuvi tick virus 2]